MIAKLKQLIDIFSNIVEKNGELYDFTYTNNAELPETIKLPLLQIYCTNIEKIRSQNSGWGYPSTIFNFYVRVIDRHNDENKIDVENQTHQIIDNIINLIETTEYFRTNEIVIDNSTIYLNKEYDNTIHKTIGWSTNLRLLVKNWGGSCGTPQQNL